MTDNSLVQKQYTEWVYPEPIEDLEVWTANHCQICDPAFHSTVLWPDRRPSAKISILVAGCGTSQAAILAFTNPQARVVGIDVSPTSLEHATKLKTKHKLDNLELHLMDLHEVDQLGRRFDLIYATGVLHHLKEPDKGLKALGRVLADDGVMCVMLYAKYGRAGVAMVQEALRHLGAEQDKHGITLTRNILASLPRWHAAQPYLRGAAGDLNYDACVVDTFLHKQERAYTVPDVLDLAAACNLTFQGWTDNLDYYPDSTFAPEHPAAQALAALPDEKHWALTELLYQYSGCHSFLLRKKDNVRDFRINFNDASYQDWIPERRYLLEVTEDGDSLLVQRSGHSYRLRGLERNLFAAIDGQTSCGVLLKQHAKTAEESEQARQFFRGMWRLGHLVYSHAG